MASHQSLRAAGLIVCLALLVLGAGAVAAQGVEADGAAPVGSADPESLEPERAAVGIPAILGRSPDRRRIIPGLFVMHPYDRQFPEVDWTRGGGVQVSTWFLAGFVNSYDRFSVIAGVERKWFDVHSGAFELGVGYRAGILTGYDERLLALAGQLPALPFGGLLVWLDVGGVSLDTFYVYKALTLEASFGF